MMTVRRLLGISCALLCTSTLAGAELSTYRQLQFGMDVSAAAKQTGMKASEATVVHRRPALIQELGWQPNSFSTSGKSDSIKYGRLGFYNNELYRIVVTYDRDRVEGMTADDMIAAISTTYGKATTPKVEIAYESNYAEVAQVLARWENSEYSYNLVRSGYGDSFALVMYSKRLDALAATAIAESIRLDAKEAPQRAMDAARKQKQDETSALDKARQANAPVFRP
jgi:hypothetical protein